MIHLENYLYKDVEEPIAEPSCQGGSVLNIKQNEKATNEIA
jgi:hypothetical protein